MATIVSDNDVKVPTAPAQSADGWSLFAQYAAQALRENVAECQDEIPVLGKAAAGTLAAGDTVTEPGVLAPIATTLFEEDRKPTFKVAIIGAGVAGLFTAYLFDYLKENYNLDVDYEILEAKGEERVGGRLFTKHFSEKPHDYYDVGAMRFPDIPIMAKTFGLFKHLNMGLVKDYKEAKEGDLIPYYLQGDNTPLRFNGRQLITKLKDGPAVTAAAFGITGLPPMVMHRNPGDMISEAIKEFTDKYDPNDPKKFWKYLMKHGDKYSVREFLRTQRGFDWNSIEWCETADFGDGWYNQALSELVLENLDFASKDWVCVMGGAQEIAKRLAKDIKHPDKIRWNSPVQKMDYIRNADRSPEKVMVTVGGEEFARRYDAVFNSAPLGAIQQMELEGLNLNWGTKQAIRSLGYGASCKVGIKFKKTWWLEHPYNIKRGGVAKTDLPLRCCVYPSYNYDDKDQEGVLLVSYSWGQEADRIGALISRQSPENEAQLKSVLLHDLAHLHTNTQEAADKLYRRLKDELYVTHYAHNWYAEPYQVGAFAYFGPGQFKDMYKYITRTDGKHIIIGEAASAHHAWVVGALESVVRGVYQFAFSHSRYSSAASEVAKAYCKKKITEQPFGPLPAEYDLTRDTKYMEKNKIAKKTPAVAELLKEELGRDDLAKYSPYGDLARQGVLIEMIRQRQGGDLLDTASVTADDIKPILDAVAAIDKGMVVPPAA